MIRNFFAVTWNHREPASREMAALISGALARSCDHLVSTSRLEGFGLYVSGTSRARVHFLSDGGGIVLGTVFKRSSTDDNTPLPRADLTGNVSSEIIASGGRYLVEHYWGHYLAFIINKRTGTKWIVRSPACHQPCLWACYRGIRLFFSDAEDCARLGLLQLSINWDFVAAFAASTRVLSSETGLNEISELLPGEFQKIFHDGHSAGFYWNPAEIAQRPPVSDVLEAKRMLRATVGSCISAWASEHPAIVQRLSGGLDSSIATICLAGIPTRPAVTCVNYHSPGALGDEREYARAVAESTGFPLVEYRHSSSIPMDPILTFPRTESPLSYMIKIASDQREIDLADTVGATARFTGIMGDVLFQMPPAGPSIGEYLQRRGVDRNFVRTALYAAQMDRVSIWSILRSGVMNGVLRPPTSSKHGEFSNRDESILSRDVTQAVFLDKPLRFVHPWLHNLQGVPYGKFMQIACLSFNSAYFNSLPDDHESDLVHPFISEPLIELCLRIPTYLLLRDGWDRALAREAFEPELPRIVRFRATKGSSNSYLKDRIESNGGLIRDLLIDGVLVKQGILDRNKLADCLPGQATRSNVPLGLLWATIASEAWSRAWVNRRSNWSEGGRSIGTTLIRAG